MTKKVNNTTSNVKGKTVNVGIDVHNLSWRVTAVVEGVVIMAVTMKPAYSVLKKFFAKFNGSRIRVAYEAGPGGFNLYDSLTADGIECFVVAPSLIPVASGNRVKTDKKDSSKLAQYLESNLLRRVWVPSAQQRAHRQILRTRRQISDHRCDVMRQIKSLLMFHGLQRPASMPGGWNKAFIAWLRNVVTDPAISISLNALVDTYEYLSNQVKQLTRQIIGLAGTAQYSKRVQLLQSIPGIGVLSAMGILSELQDVSRFKTADQLAAYIGLTPSQYSSGQHVRMGKITHMGNHRLRTLLVECSWQLIRRDPQLAQLYAHIKLRRGAKRAIVAISRRLIIRIRRILLDETPYSVQLLRAA